MLGGKCREAAACYAHAGGTSKEEVVDSIRSFMEQGYHHIRVQLGGYGGLNPSRQLDAPVVEADHVPVLIHEVVG